MDLMSFIATKLVILVPILLGLGKIFKEVPHVPNWIIPLILTILGAIGGMALIGWTIDGVLGGILCACVAVYGNQFWKQSIEGSNSGEESNE